MAANSSFSTINCCALMLIFATRLAHCASERVSSNCDERPLEELLDEQGKWKSYDFVMGNCLARRFLEQHDGGTNIDIYSSLNEFEVLVGQNLQLNEQQLEAAKKDADGLAKINKIRYDLTVRNAIRQSKRKSLMLNKLLEEMRVQVSLVDNQINGAMEECLRKSKRDSKKTDDPLEEAGVNTHAAGIEDKCSRQLDSTLTRVRALCRHLNAHIALQQLARKIYQLT